MGTRGYKVYRYRKWYWVIYNHFDSYPRVFGVHLLRTIPRKPDAFQAWVDRMRDEFNVAHEAWQRSEDKAESEHLFQDTAPQNDVFIEWIYEFDLDNLVFHIDSQPVFRLQNMPDENEFLAWIGYDNYAHRSYSFNTPEEYRYEASLVKYVPPMAPEVAQQCANLPEPVERWKDIVQSAPVQQSAFIISELAVGCLAGYFRSIIFDWRATGPVDPISSRQRQYAHSLIGLCLAPKIWANKLAVRKSLDSGGGNDEFWWATDTICVLLVGQMYAENTLKKAVVEIVAEIRKSRPDGKAFGVICSVIEVAIVSVVGDSVRFTSTLDFIPPFFSQTSATEGISALVSLGHLSFRECIFRFVHRRNGENKCPGPDIPKAPREDGFSKLPNELIAIIFGYMPSSSIMSFAAVSKLAMDLSIPMIKTQTPSVDLITPIDARPTWAPQMAINPNDEDGFNGRTRIISWLKSSKFRGTLVESGTLCDVNVKIPEMGYAEVGELQSAPILLYGQFNIDLEVKMMRS